MLQFFYFHEAIVALKEKNKTTARLFVPGGFVQLSTKSAKELEEKQKVTKHPRNL